MRPAWLAIVPIAGLILAAGLNPLSNNDVWLHLTTGRLILERGQIPRIDEYSFTRAGSPYVAHEWLAQVLFYLVHRAAGTTGLILLKPLALGATAWLVALSCRRLGGGPTAALWAAVLSVAAMASHLFSRPHLFTFTMLAATALLLARWRAGDRRAILLLAAIGLLWANLHGGFVLGIALCLAMGAWAPAMAMTLASLINPYGIRLYRFVLVFADPVFRRRIREWAGPFDPPFPGSFHFYVYCFLALLALAAAAHHLARRRPGAAAAIGLFFALSMAAKRNVSLLGIVAAPWIGLAASEAFAASGRLSFRRIGTRTAYLLSCSAVWLAAAGAATLGVPHETGRARRMGLGVAGNVPVAAMDYVVSRGIEGNALDSFAFGAYVTWRAWPATKVFIDSRLDVFGGAFVEQYCLAMADPARARDLMQGYRFDYAVLSYRLDDVEGPVRAFAADGGWALVYFDDLAMVYVRREPRFLAIIAGDEYRSVNPYLFVTGRPSMAPQAGGDGALAETERALAASPSSLVARLMKGTALQGAGRHREAVALLEPAEPLLADDATGRALLLGLLGTSYLEMGEPARARLAFQRLLDLTPDSAYARRMLESMKKGPDGPG